MKKFFFFIFSLCLLLLSAQAVFAQEGLKSAIDGMKTSAEGNFDTGEEASKVSVLVGKLVGSALSFVGVIFFILVIYGGLLWMTARGNEQQISKAKELLYSAVIGLIIIVAAYSLTKYIGTILN